LGAPPGESSRFVSLDDTIRVALMNSEVVRLLGGVSAASSGRTVYDPAISNTFIDQAQARFDPRVEANHGFNRFEQPSAIFDPLDPQNALFMGSRSDNYRLSAGVSKTVITGAEARLGVTADPTRVRPGTFPLNPQSRSAVELSLTQPLLQGGGIRANLAPIVIARIDTERSYFQYKDSVQELVRGTIEAYWGVVFARVNVWARQQQVTQSRFAYERADAQWKAGLGDAGDAAQAQVAYSNFRANLIAAEAGLLEREAALRNVLGLSAGEPIRVVPTTPPTSDRIEPNWNAIVELATQRRPDLIEIKLVLEADEQRIVQAANQASPRLDAVALYRWNGLEGEVPSGATIATSGGDFTDWTLGVNFSVPIGLRQGRAALRQQELLLSRDRANLQQGIHNATHVLARNVRNLALNHEQYLAFRDYREAARLNLDKQMAAWRAGLEQFLVLLQAINDWGNAVASEAQALTQYNVELANLERQTGTILETHGIRFAEERFRSVGPLGRIRPGECYPRRLPPTGNEPRYPAGEGTSDSFFNLQNPIENAFQPLVPYQPDGGPPEAVPPGRAGPEPGPSIPQPGPGAPPPGPP
jgi:outer membrane protein TolC